LAQIPRADVLMGLLAPMLLLDVFAKLHQRREAKATAAVVVGVERISVYKAFAMKVDEGETKVAGDQVRSHQHLDVVAQPAAKASAGNSAEPPVRGGLTLGPIRERIERLEAVCVVEHKRVDPFHQTTPHLVESLVQEFSARPK